MGQNHPARGFTLAPRPNLYGYSCNMELLLPVQRSELNRAIGKSYLQRGFLL